ncbi:MAG: hypothetical protein BWX51_01293 [Bacteroidetes bacterium ADurb.Bin012]|jgi:hypothetical protein|nr:MAG: hypothetical protein BWX51_01293 [Bacteroidetes bacterium ADurb.Bin012]
MIFRYILFELTYTSNILDLASQKTENTSKFIKNTEKIT